MQPLLTTEETSEVKKPSRWTAYQGGIVVLLTLGMIINYMARINFSIVMPTLIKEYSLLPAAAGVLLSVSGWSQAFGNLFIGALADRFHPRRVFPTGVGLWSLATMLGALSANVFFLGFTRFVLGIAESTVLPCSSKLVSELFKKDSQGKVIGTYFSGTKIGLAVGAPLSAVILVAYGWQAVFIVTGVLSALWLVPWFLIYRPNKEVIQEVLPLSGAGEAAQPKVKWYSLLSSREVWILALGQGIYLYVYYVFLTWLPGYLVLERHMSILKTGILSVIPFLLAVFVGIFSGWLGDLWLRKGASVSLVRKTFIGLGFMLSTVFVIAGTNIDTEGPALFCIFMSMGILGMVSPNINALPIDLAPRRFVSTVASLQNVGGNIGGALAPVVTGVLFGITGSFQIALWVTGGVALVGSLVHVFLLRKIEPCIGIDR